VVALLALVTEASDPDALCFLICLSRVCQQEGASLLWCADRSFVWCLQALVLAVRCWEVLSWLFMRLGVGVFVRFFDGKKMGGKKMKPSCRDAAFLALMKHGPYVPATELPRHSADPGEVRFLSASAQGFELNEADE
jgi:hypothetical protein